MTHLEIIRSRQDFDLAVQRALNRLGLTWHELIVMAYSGSWTSEDARLTWETIQETVGMV